MENDAHDPSTPVCQSTTNSYRIGGTDFEPIPKVVEPMVDADAAEKPQLHFFLREELREIKEVRSDEHFRSGVRATFLRTGTAFAVLMADIATEHQRQLCEQQRRMSMLIHEMHEDVIALADERWTRSGPCTPQGSDHTVSSAKPSLARRSDMAERVRSADPTTHRSERRSGCGEVLLSSGPSKPSKRSVPAVVSHALHESVNKMRGTRATSMRSDVPDAREDIVAKKQVMEDEYNYLLAHKTTTLSGLIRRYLYRNNHKTNHSFVRSVLSHLVESKVFYGATAVLIVVNTLLVGVTSDSDLQTSMSRYQDPETASGQGLEDTLLGFEIFLVVAFCVELVLRILATGRDFWFGETWKGNLFDTVVTVGGVVDITLLNFNLSFGRMLRLVRLFSTMRTFRHVKMGVRLRTMVIAIASSLPFLLWASLLLGLTTYIFACVLVQGTSLYIDQASQGDLIVDFLYENLSSTSMVMITLWASVTGGVSWMELELKLLDMHVMLGMVFVVYHGVRYGLHVADRQCENHRLGHRDAGKQANAEENQDIGHRDEVTDRRHLRNGA